MRESEDFYQALAQRAFRPRTIIDVGVANGTEPLYVAFPDAYYHLFEPVDEFSKTIEWILTRIRGEHWPCALSDRAGKMNIFVGEQLAGASIMHRGIASEDPRLRVVDVRTLDEVFADRRLEGPILLKTDCQGADLRVIQGGRQLIQQCDVIVMEVCMYHYWSRDTADFTEIVRYMADEGFVAYDFFGYLPRPFDGAVGQIDIAFVKKNGMLRASHTW